MFRKCSFCDQPENKVKELVSNKEPHIPTFICNYCILEYSKLLNSMCEDDEDVERARRFANFSRAKYKAKSLGISLIK
jgi:ATP-dependent protease Clp ATPase subunit